MCWSLGINHPSKKWRLGWRFHTSISQQNSNGKVSGEKLKVTVFHKHISWMSAHGLHSPLLSFFAEGSYFSNDGYPILNGLLQKVCLKWQFVLCKYTHRLGSIFLVLSWIELKSHFPNLINILLVVQEGTDAPWKYPTLKHHVRSGIVKGKHHQGGYTQTSEHSLSGILCFSLPLESYSISQHVYFTHLTIGDVSRNYFYHAT